MLLTAGILCYLLARYLSSPVVKLRAATQRLAAGDLSARVGAANGRRRDELADLGRDFDVMAERIQSLMGQRFGTFNHSARGRNPRRVGISPQCFGWRTTG
jgi:two-component system sensor histidine kinase CpxA